MARPNQDAIETFMSITGLSEATAIQKLEEHSGDLTEAVNAHFNEGDRNITQGRSSAAPQDDIMDIDDPIPFESRRPPFPFLPSTRNLNPFSILDPNFTRSVFDSGTNFVSREPLVSHPREVREIPIELKDENLQSSHCGNVPTIEDVTGTEAHGPETHGTVVVSDDEDVDVVSAPTTHAATRDRGNDDIFGGNPSMTYSRPSAPVFNELPDYSNDIEEEMIRAAIEASKRDAELSSQQSNVHSDLETPVPQKRQSDLDDADIGHAVSLSLKTAEQEKALCEVEEKGGSSEPGVDKPAEVKEPEKFATSNGRLEVGGSSVQEEAEDMEEEQPLIRNRNRFMPSGVAGSAKEAEEIEDSPPSSPRQRDEFHQPPEAHNFQSDEWGGISSEEHDEAVMLEAAMFGGIPERTGYRFPYAPHELMQNTFERTMEPYPRRTYRPPSPSLEAQRLLREQQDDEYLASLQADREKELKAQQEAEAALAEERQREEALRKKLEEEQEIERQLASKEASLPQEPSPDDENAVTLLVRMPDGSRRGRRYLKSDKLQYLFDFIDVGKGVKPGSYRLVRPYPRRAFSDGESALTLSELGLTSKQEALFLELI